VTYGYNYRPPHVEKDVDIVSTMLFRYWSKKYLAQLRGDTNIEQNKNREERRC
jgi:hypothetical protein